MGVDASLTCTGISYRIDGAIKTYSIKGGHLRAGYRLSYMARMFEKHLLISKPTLVVIENYAVNRRMGVDNVLGLAELGGVLKRAIWDLGIATLCVTPNSMKMAITGKGNAKKPEVAAALLRRYGVKIPRHDEADACGLMLTGEIFSGASTIPPHILKSTRLGKLRECTPIPGRLKSIAIELKK